MPFVGSQGVVSGLISEAPYYFAIVGMRWNWIIYGTVWGGWSNLISATPD